MDCSRCVFKDCIPSSGGPFGGPQTGCLANRIETLKERGKAEYKDGCYHLSQFCNMYRTQKWADLHEEEDLLELATKETQTSFGIVICYDEKKSQMETTESIKNVDYPPRLINVVFSADEKAINVSKHFFIDHVHRLQNNGNGARFVMNLIDDKEMTDRSAFFPLLGSRCDYLIKIKQGQKIDPDYFNFINTSQNEKLDITTFFEDEENGVSVVPRSVVDNTYLDYQNYDLMCEGIKKLSIQQETYKKYEKKQEIHNQPKDATR